MHFDSLQFSSFAIMKIINTLVNDSRVADFKVWSPMFKLIDRSQINKSLYLSLADDLTLFHVGFLDNLAQICCAPQSGSLKWLYHTYYML